MTRLKHLIMVSCLMLLSFVPCHGAWQAVCRLPRYAATSQIYSMQSQLFDRAHQMQSRRSFSLDPERLTQKSIDINKQECRRLAAINTVAAALYACAACYVTKDILPLNNAVYLGSMAALRLHAGMTCLFGKHKAIHTASGLQCLSTIIVGPQLLGSIVCGSLGAVSALTMGYAIGGGIEVASASYENLKTVLAGSLKYFGVSSAEVLLTFANAVALDQKNKILDSKK